MRTNCQPTYIQSPHSKRNLWDVFSGFSLRILYTKDHILSNVIIRFAQVSNTHSFIHSKWFWHLSNFGTDDKIRKRTKWTKRESAFNHHLQSSRRSQLCMHWGFGLKEIERYGNAYLYNRRWLLSLPHTVNGILFNQILWIFFCIVRCIHLVQYISSCLVFIEELCNFT